MSGYLQIILEPKQNKKMETNTYISEIALRRVYKDNMTFYAESFISNIDHLDKVMKRNFDQSLKFYIDFDVLKEVYVIHYINHEKNRETRGDFYYASDMKFFIENMLKAFCIL